MAEYIYYDFPSSAEATPMQARILLERQDAIVHLDAERVDGWELPDGYLAYRNGLIQGWRPTLGEAEALIQQQEVQ